MTYPTETAISAVDEPAGRLTIRGYDLADLADACCFEEVAYLLWHGRLPDSVALRETTHALAARRALTLPMLQLLTSFPRSAPPLAVLRTAVSALGVHDPRAQTETQTPNLEVALRLTALAPTIVATFHQLRRGEEPPVPDPGLSHAANFLYCLRGTPPDELATQVFDDCLILHAEGGLDPSALAARVAASTQADMVSAVTAAVGALSGSLWADPQVVGMLQEIGQPERARGWVLERLGLADELRSSAWQGVPGFRNPVYPAADPRAALLREWCLKLGEHLGQPYWYEVSRAVEEVMLQEQGLHPTVDFYSASVYTMLGIQRDLFACVLAAARMAGWTAHILEQGATGRLIVGRGEYTGPTGVRVPPLEER